MDRRSLLKGSAAATGLSFFSFRPTAALAQLATAAGGAAGAVLGAPRLALVIGNDRYRDSPLKNPVNDARAISAELQASDFAVTTLLDAGLADLRARVDAFGKDLAKTKGVGVFYFAGHGIQLSWRNYLLPVDTQIGNTEEVPQKAVDLAQLLETMGKAGNPANIVILDACRNNPFGRDFRIEQKGLSQVDAPVGTLLAYATAPGNVAIDGEGTNGLYTEYLLKEMKVQDAKVEDIFKRVRLAVRRQSKGFQIPWESTSLEEDFYFQPPEELRRAAEAERQKRAEAEQAARRQEEERRRKEEEARLAREKAEAERKRQLEEERQARLRQEAEERRRLEEELRKSQLAEAERQRRLKEAEAARAQAEAERQRQLKEAEDARAKAEAEANRRAEEERRAQAAAEAARQQKEAEAALARQQAEASRRRALEEARAAKERDEAERKRRYEAELAEWEKIVESSDAAAFAAFLYRYPTGSFTELAQLRLDQLLAREGEKRVEVVNAPANPFSKGTARADVGYKVGDTYTYRVTDLYTGREIRVGEQRVSAVRDTQVEFNGGRLVFDPLGNILRLPDGRRFVGRQDQPLEYAVGRKWLSRFEVQLPNGSISQNEVTMRVTTRERITVGAGTFECYKIEGSGGGFSNDGGQVVVSSVAWVAPDRVRRAIASEQRRTVYRRGGPGRVLNSERTELLAYTQA